MNYWIESKENADKCQRQDWLLPKSTVGAWEQIPCWKEPQRVVKHDIVPHCTGNRMGCFGCVVGFLFSLGRLWFWFF